jgi:hypothetical protein
MWGEAVKYSFMSSSRKRGSAEAPLFTKKSISPNAACTTCLGKKTKALKIVLSPFQGRKSTVKGFAGKRVVPAVVVKNGQFSICVAANPSSGFGLPFKSKPILL